MTETKIVDLDELYKYYVDDFFTRNKKCHFFFKFKFLNCTNKLINKKKLKLKL